MQAKSPCFQGAFQDFELCLTDLVRFSLFLGKDVNIAPRFTTSWDLFGNGGSVITVGANRYYGRNILTYALYKAQNGGMENIYDYASDDSPAADGWFAANDFDGLERLKTPFSQIRQEPSPLMTWTTHPMPRQSILADR